MHGLETLKRLDDGELKPNRVTRWSVRQRKGDRTTRKGSSPSIDAALSIVDRACSGELAPGLSSLAGLRSRLDQMPKLVAYLAESGPGAREALDAMGYDLPAVEDDPIRPSGCSCAACQDVRATVERDTAQDPKDEIPEPALWASPRPDTMAP